MKARESLPAGRRAAITGVGLLTPLGSGAREILRRMERGETAAAPPGRFDARPFACPLSAEIHDFDPRGFVSDQKTLRLMNRDAQLAVAAARLAMEDAGIRAGREYEPEEIALFGATGLAGIQIDEIAPLLRHSAAPDGSFDPARFGSEALKRVRPILSFKILSNMPICFVSIFQGIQGPNAVYNPWEGQGARALASGIAAIRLGEVPCAVVGGCDVKTHELAFLALEEEGVFRTWREEGRGTVPGEGAAFLVIEDEERARSRGARAYARIGAWSFRTARDGSRRDEARRRVLSGLPPRSAAVLVSGEEGDRRAELAEDLALKERGIEVLALYKPKLHAGNLFAAAAFLQVGLAAALAGSSAQGREVLACCFGHGSEQAAFLLEAP